MSPIFFTALGFGFLGSLHCVGMCGPIVLCLPNVGKTRLQAVLSRLAYNLGRIVTYTAMGAVCGLIGHFVSLAGYQKALSVAAGLLIILAVVLPSKFARKLMPYNPATKLAAKGREWWEKLLHRRSYLSLFGIGVLNGLLPCGFLYLGLATSVTTGSAGAAALYMTMFGLGTAPALLATSVASGLFTAHFRAKMLKLVPVTALAMGAVLVLRGMSLGIPYLSPTLQSAPAPTTEVRHDCCK